MFGLLPDRLSRFLFLFTLVTAMTPGVVHAADAGRPNIVLIYADDLGYGDVGCYGADAVKTPNIDRVAASGIRFTDGHSTSATCTPSRYALLTGEYPWRKKGTGILPGDARMIIEPGRTTVASMLKSAGYRTGVVGKWHLGLGGDNLDWNGDITPCPLDIGFDESFIMAATGDRVPCVYVEGRRVVGLDPKDPIQVSYGKPVGNEPLGRDHPELLKMKFSHGHDMTIVNGISRIGTMAGGKSARWVDEDMADVFTKKGVEFIEKNAGQPFFLYFATQDIHVPRVPHARFVGSTSMGPRGDAIAEFDWCVGRLMKALESKNLVDNTLVIITSDNGPVIDDGYLDDAVKKLGDHKAAGPLRGGKYSHYEAGTRVPFIVSWPDRIKQPSVSAALVCQIDFLASFAGLVETQLRNPGDSQNHLDAFIGASATGREVLVEQGSRLALRHRNWKFIPGGKGQKRNATGNELGNDPLPQLFDLSRDLGEQNNLALSNTQVLEAMRTMLDTIQTGLQ
jgi:arylsulfatase A-like enzyme